MMLTDSQIAQLRQIIIDYHAAYVVNHLGSKTVPETVVARLRELGLVNLEGNAALDAFAYGKLLSTLNTPQAAQMSFGQFSAYLKTNPMPLTPVEQHAVDIAAARAAQFVAGLGNRIATDTGELIINGDAELRRQMQATINTKVSQGIAQRQSVQQVKSELGHAMVDWSRDLDRIAATETSRAMNQGLAADLRDRRGNDVEVSVLSRRGCCPECAKAYVGPDGAPIIFKLDDLEANGTNYKKKKADKLPVVPPYHPSCACSLIYIPKRAGYDADNNLVPRGPRGVRPHAAAFKSMAARRDDLQKAFAGPQPMDWWGIRVHDLTAIDSALDAGPPHTVPGALLGRVKTRTGQNPCIVGPHPLACTAYVAHGPTHDCLLLGYHEAESAQLAYLALAAAAGDKLGAASQYSHVPVHELAAWLAQPPVAHVLPGPMAKAGPAVYRRPDPRPDGRLVLPMGPLKRPAVKVTPEAYRLYDPERLINRRIRLRAKPCPGVPANPPQKRKKPVATQALGVRGCRDDSLRQDAKLVIRERVKRMPVTYLRPLS